jgi:hypothetical protein
MRQGVVFSHEAYRNGGADGNNEAVKKHTEMAMRMIDDGRAPVHTKSKGKQSSLEEYLGLEKGTGYSLLNMKEAGFSYDAETKTEIDPWPGGISTTWDPKSYKLKAIMPLGLYTKPKYLQ